MKDAISNFISALNISDTALQARIRQLFSVRSVKKGTILFRPGQTVTEMVFLASPGVARGFVVNHDGKEVTDCFAHKIGECISTDYPTDHKPFVSDTWTQALTDFEVVAISLTDLDILCKEFSQVADIQSAMLEESWITHRDTKRIVNGRTSTIERIKWFYEVYQDVAKCKITDKYIASFLGMSEVTLSKKRKEIGLCKV